MMLRLQHLKVFFLKKTVYLFEFNEQNDFKCFLFICYFIVLYLYLSLKKGFLYESTVCDGLAWLLEMWVVINRDKSEARSASGCEHKSLILFYMILEDFGNWILAGFR